MPTVRKDAIGFGALNVDLLYTIKDFSLIQRIRVHARRGGEYLVGEAEMDALRGLLDGHGQFITQSGGGQAANVMSALARMGFNTGLVGAVGADALGTFLLNSLQGVDTSRMPRLGKSGVCLIAVDETMDRTNFVLPNANDALGADLVDVGYLNSASLVHLSSFAGDLPFQAQQAALPRLSDPRISFDPGELYCRKGLDGLATILKQTYLLFLTEWELKYLTGLNPREGAAKLLECGVTIVACKRGRRGALIFSQDETHEVPAPEMEVVDPTGAGDVFAAGFLAGVLLDRSVAECAQFAADVASQSVAGYGREKYPDAGVLRRAFDLPAEGGGAPSQ